MSAEKKSGSLTFEEVISNAKEIMLRDGVHNPALIVEGNNSLIAGQVNDMPYTHGERVQLMRYLGQATAKSGRIKQLNQVFMVSEGWLSIPSDTKQDNIRPSQDPDRKEVLIISGIQIREQKKQIKALEIVRDENNLVTGLEEFLPAATQDQEIAIPLLDAFVEGFQTAYRLRYN